MGWRPLHPDQREARLQSLQRKFAKAMRPLERQERRHRWQRRAIPVLKLLAVAGTAALAVVLFWTTTLPASWPLGVKLAHIAAAPSCSSARLLALAPASMGEPGYWPKLDPDKDGIACEPVAR